uniref:DUF222 domain-containing protein n=1 Tax=Rhodococcus sp. BS-15 TaxID=1304954 RepID=UPI0035B54912
KKAAAHDAAAARDIRTPRERQHDALKLALRQTLASGTLGTHRGLPVTAIVTMTLRDLEAGRGYAKTATGSRISIRDAIRMASHAHHYLTLFDDHGRASTSADPNASPPPTNASCSSPATEAAVSPPAPAPQPGARPITSTTGPPVASPTSTPSPSAATCTTHSSAPDQENGQPPKPQQRIDTRDAPSGTHQPGWTPNAAD